MTFNKKHKKYMNIETMDKKDIIKYLREEKEWVVLDITTRKGFSECFDMTFATDEDWLEFAEKFNYNFMEWGWMDTIQSIIDSIVD